MKRLGNLWPQIVSFENVLLAYRKARLGKKTRQEVAIFSLNLEANLFLLQAELKNQCYRPGKYRLFTIYERKPRQIAAAPFRDRIVHHAILNIIEPLLDTRLIDDCYACRKGRGVHKAVNRYQQWASHYQYVLKLDIRRYFPSIDRIILKEKCHHYLKDPFLLRLLEQIIDNGPINNDADVVIYYPGDDIFSPATRQKGIPIGNLTSQFFANLYLNEFDHWIKETCRCRAYLRYVDDMVLLSNDKGMLHEMKHKIIQRLIDDRLTLHPKKQRISQVKEGLDLLGYTVFADFKLLRNDNGFRFSRRLNRLAKHYHSGYLQWGDFNASVQSWIGHAKNADTLGLRRHIFAKTVFKKGVCQ